MSARYLGEAFDIHAGGADLMAPHHENEMSQSCAAHGTPGMARHWVHNGMLTVGGRKMSKSLGNFVTVQEAIGGSPERALALRLLMLSTHYRGALDYSTVRLDEAEAALSRMRSRLEGVEPGKADPRALAFLMDDMNVPGAMSRLHALLHDEGAGQLEAAAGVLGLLGLGTEGLPTSSADALSADALSLLAFRQEARQRKDWSEADRLRQVLLEEHGINLKDTVAGTSWKLVSNSAKI